MAFIQDCTNEALLKLQNYLTKNNIIVKSIEPFEGLDNKSYGDLKVECFKTDDSQVKINIDFKRQMKADEFIYIELLFINAAGEFGGWLYNSDIDWVIYELKDGRTFLFTHKQLLQIAKSYNINEMWNSSTIYSKNPSKYQSERIWITNKLIESGATTIRLPSLKIDPEHSHIRACYNYNSYGKTLSGFSMAIEPSVLEKFQIK